MTKKRLLKCVNALISSVEFEDVLRFLNENNVYYEGWSDLSMIKYYLENCEEGKLT